MKPNSTRTNTVKLTTFALLAAALTGAAQAQTKNPGVLTSLTIADWSTFDPAQCYDTACGEVIQNTIETLYFPRPFDLEKDPGGDKITFEPLLAAAMPVYSNGGKTVTIKLNPKAKFSDGSDITADDVKYSIARQLIESTDGGPATLLLEPLIGTADAIRKGGKVGFDQVDKSMTVKDKETIVFNLAKPFAPFTSVLAHPAAAVYSKAAAIKAGEWDGTKATWESFNNAPLADSKFANVLPLGSGPFVLQRYDKGSQVILKRNDKYWRAPAKLQTVVIKNVGEVANAVQQIRTGDADQTIVGAYPRNVATQFDNLPGAKIVDGVSQLVLQTLFMNFDIKDTAKLGTGKLDEKGIPATFFSDANVRRGFAASFDYQAMLRDQLLGKGLINNVVIPTQLPGYNAALKYKFDKTQATAFFKRAWGGKLWTSGFTVPIYWNSGNANRQKAAEILKRGVEALNPKFHIDVREAQFSAILADAAARRQSMWLLGWQADYADSHNFAQPFLASTGNYPQNTGYKNATVDKLIDQAVASTNTATRTSLYKRIAQIGFVDVASIPIWQGVAYTAQRDWVKGRVTNPLYSGDIYYYTSK
jgi:peptide/nickel transport system substrate-binding protein